MLLSASASAAAAPRFADHSRTQRATLAWAVGWVGLWVLYAAAVNTGQLGDSIEQFNWAHSLEWGYYKHPPLPTWLLGGLIAVFGQAPWQTYLLAGGCIAGTAWFTHDIARRLFGARTAAVAIVLWGLQMPFSWRAQLYNHNTLLVLMVSFTAWCVLHALDGDRRRWWFAAGAGAALAMLSKYQAALPLAGIGIALLLAGELKRTQVRSGVLLAAAVAAVLFMPHLWWLQQHDWMPLHYAATHDRQMGASGREHVLVSFIANQLRFLLPALLCIALLTLFAQRARTDGPEAAAALSRRQRSWLIGLIAVPLGAIVLLALARGVALQNHWGMQALQFVSLWLAWRIVRNAPPKPLLLFGTAGALQLLGMALYLQAPHVPQGKFADLRFPSAELVQRVQRSWSARTHCPLEYVAGSAYPAGVYSVYAGDYPEVQEEGSPLASPWVDVEEMRLAGAVYFSFDRAKLPPEAQHIESMTVPVSKKRPHDGPVLYWGLLPPRDDCGN
jgi:4-amino-4-deoxy-L-arabinose transferase-like glycosyltransferase